MIHVTGSAVQATGTAQLTIGMVSLANRIGTLASGFTILAAVSAPLLYGMTTLPSRSRTGVRGMAAQPA
jgi:hypothetical protein